jgi:hypothetical protein
LANFEALATDNELLEFTHGHGLVWPHQLLVDLFCPINGGSLDEGYVVERKRLDQYFRTPSEEQQAQQTFVGSITTLVKSTAKSGVQDDKVFEERLSRIHHERYQHDREMAKSLVHSLIRTPAYIRYHFDDWNDNKIHHPLSGMYPNRYRCWLI